MFNVIKVVISLVLILVIAFAIESLFVESTLPLSMAIGVIAGCIFMIALLWAGKQLETNRFGALVTLFVGLCMVGGGIKVGSGEFPKVCDMPRPKNCLNWNVVAEIGGPWLAAAPLLVFGVFLLVMAVGLIREKSK
jgi:hypothetical protein